MHRHPYGWPILAENRWPNHGRKLTGRAGHREQCRGVRRPAPGAGLRAARATVAPNAPGVLPSRHETVVAVERLEK